MERQGMETTDDLGRTADTPCTPYVPVIVHPFPTATPTSEILIGVALLFRQTGMMTCAPRPKRHADVMMQAIQHNLPTNSYDCEQGFYTNLGRFVDRQEAMRIARDAGQIIRNPTFQPNTLFSEDVW